MSNLTFAIHPHRAGCWQVIATARHGAHTADASIVVAAAVQPDTGTPLHGGLAASLAWAALGHQLLAGDAVAAAACFRAGLTVLGERYATFDVSEDTGLKIAAAEQQLAKGHAEQGANGLAAMLALRQGFYRDRYADALVA
ncbi:MAG: hypothetical protein K1X39_05625 [Thermoflexales bacterium]|nr:hypothetical protein [Thermoflexales bacterium]